MQENISLASQGAGAIITFQSKVLLVQLNYGPAKGHWILPGGMIEHGEHPEQAAIREVKEETNLEAIMQSLISVRHRIDHKNRHNIYWVFKAQIAYENPELHLKWPKDEIMKAEFWDYTKAMNAPQVRPMTKVFLEAYKKHNCWSKIDIPDNHKYNDHAYL